MAMSISIYRRHSNLVQSFLRAATESTTYMLRAGKESAAWESVGIEKRGRKGGGLVVLASWAGGHVPAVGAHPTPHRI
jgi:hypothetical protein